MENHLKINLKGEHTMKIPCRLTKTKVSIKGSIGNGASKGVSKND